MESGVARFFLGQQAKFHQFRDLEQRAAGSNGPRACPDRLKKGQGTEDRHIQRGSVVGGGSQHVLLRDIGKVRIWGH